jgi:hypothetical protein
MGMYTFSAHFESSAGFSPCWLSLHNAIRVETKMFIFFFSAHILAEITSAFPCNSPYSFRFRDNFRKNNFRFAKTANFFKMPRALAPD